MDQNANHVQHIALRRQHQCRESAGESQDPIFRATADKTLNPACTCTNKLKLISGLCAAGFTVLK